MTFRIRRPLAVILTDSCGSLKKGLHGLRSQVMEAALPLVRVVIKKRSLIHTGNSRTTGSTNRVQAAKTLAFQQKP
jgi:hypothetical protein